MTTRLARSDLSHGRLRLGLHGGSRQGRTSAERDDGPSCGCHVASISEYESGHRFLFMSSVNEATDDPDEQNGCPRDN